MTAFLIILVVQMLVTNLMTGLIWFVQVVHYPLFARVGTSHFPNYARDHMRQTTHVVAPLMITELACAVLTVVLAPAFMMPLATLGLLLVLVIWLSTFTLQVPCHSRLLRAFDKTTQEELTRTNWARTILWTIRSVIVTWMLLDLQLG